LNTPIIHLFDAPTFKVAVNTHSEKRVIVRKLQDKSYTVILRVPSNIEYGLQSASDPLVPSTCARLADCVSIAISLADTDRIYFETA
jgi:hypothetical protein